MLTAILETISQVMTDYGRLSKECDAVIIQIQMVKKFLADLTADMETMMVRTDVILRTANSADLKQNKVQYWLYILNAAKAFLFNKDAVSGVRAILIELSNDSDEGVKESKSIKQKFSEITEAMRKLESS